MAPAENSFERLQRSLEAFYQALEASPFQGVSQIARLAKLRVLIERFPVEARRILDELDQA